MIEVEFWQLGLILQTDRYVVLKDNRGLVNWLESKSTVFIACSDAPFV